MKKIYTIFSLCFLFASINANAQLIFSESFTYPDGNLEGSNAGTGFNTAWSNVGTGNTGGVGLAQIVGNKLQVSLPGTNVLTTVRYDRTIPLTLDGIASTQEYWLGFWLRIPAANLSTSTYGVTAQIIFMNGAYSTVATDMRLGYGKTSNFTTGANTANALTQFTRCAAAINWPGSWNTATAAQQANVGLSTTVDNLKYILVQIKKSEFLNTKMASTTTPNPNAASNFDGYRYWIMSAPPSGPSDPIFTAFPNGHINSDDAETGLNFPIQSRVLRGDGGTTCVKDGITGLRVRVEGNPGTTPFFAEFDDIRFSTTLGPLAVKMGDIKASASGKNNIVTWATTTETNSKSFIVEQSYNSLEWKQIGVVAAAGNSNSEIKYSFTDYSPYSTTYYRLRQMDIDGKTTITNIAKVEQDLKTKILITPNPTQDFLSVRLDKPTNNNLIAIYDIAGRLMVKTQFDGVLHKVNVSAFKKGVYFLQTTVENTKTVQKFVKD